MGKFDGYLLGTDLDGTLLKGDKSVSAENLDAIEYFKKEGGVFTMFTGRLPIGAKPVLERVKPTKYMGCANGAGIYDIEDKRLIWSLSLADGIKELIDSIYKNQPWVGIEITTDKIYFVKKSPQTEKHRTDELLPDLCCDYKTFDQPIIKVLLGVGEDRLQELLDFIKIHPMYDKFDYIRSDREYFEVLPRGASKGLLLEKIAGLHGIDMKKTIVLGDNENDISMLKIAGVGVAVANAVDSAKKAANHHTVTNEESAVARVIDELDRGVLFSK